MEKHAFGAHRWRWSNHLAAYLAEGLLARAAAGADRMDDAHAAAAEARATIERLAARAPESALRQTFLAWPRVQAALGEAERRRST